MIVTSWLFVVFFGSEWTGLKAKASNGALAQGAAYDDFTGNFVAQDYAGWKSSGLPQHVLITSANVGRDDAEDNAVIDSLTARCNKLRIVDALYFDLSWLHEGDATICRHNDRYLLFELRGFVNLLSKQPQRLSESPCGNRFRKASIYTSIFGLS